MVKNSLLPQAVFKLVCAFVGSLVVVFANLSFANECAKLVRFADYFPLNYSSNFVTELYNIGRNGENKLISRFHGVEILEHIRTVHLSDTDTNIGLGYIVRVKELSFGSFGEKKGQSFESRSQKVFHFDRDGNKYIYGRASKEDKNQQLHMIVAFPEHNKVWMNFEGTVYQWTAVKNYAIPSVNGGPDTILPEAFIKKTLNYANVGDSKAVREALSAPNNRTIVEELMVFVKNKGFVYSEARTERKIIRKWDFVDNNQMKWN